MVSSAASLPDLQMATFFLPLCMCATGVSLCAHISSSYSDWMTALPIGIILIIHLFKGPVSKYSHILTYWGKELQYMIFFPGDKIQPITHNIKGHAGKNTYEPGEMMVSYEVQKNLNCIF